MLRTFFRYSVHLIMTFAVAGFISTSNAVAQSVDDFLANPAQVLAQFPNGGARLISLVRDTAVAHPEALQTLINLMKSANNPAIETAFGSGLGQAAQIVAKTNESYANQIRAAVAASGSEAANLAMNSVSSDVAIASVGGGGGGDAGGGSGGTAGGSGTGGLPSGGANTGTGQVFGSNSFQTSSQTFTGGGAGVGGASNSNSSQTVSPR